MSQAFYERPILNSPYAYPGRHWKLDARGQPTDEIVASRRTAEFISPVPATKAQSGKPTQLRLALGEKALSTAEQQYNPYPVINRIRREVDRWRELPEAEWGVTPETARLLRHWRHHAFLNLRPFFCQVEAAETAIWLVEVAGALRESGDGLKRSHREVWNHLHNANASANPELLRIALKMATGAGKTTVMAMLIAWQTVNAVRYPQRRNFTRGFLLVTPGITIRDRLRVLLPQDPESYYRTRELVPHGMLGDVKRAAVVITNFHAFQRRERLKLAKGTRALLRGRGETPPSTETEGQMLQRVMAPLLGMKSVLVLNDEGHHCYRANVLSQERGLAREEKEEAKRNEEAARVWISGIETLRRKLPVPVVFDLSATPFFLRGSGYAEGTLFPWTVSDFSLMDAIESGIVKLPRVPVSDNVPGAQMPKLRVLWEHIGKQMPKKVRGKTAAPFDPGLFPPLLETAASALYTHYERTFRQWAEAGIKEPPVFIVVCNNVATSKLLYDYLGGYQAPLEDKSPGPWQGGFELFLNYDETGNRLPRPRTLLIDSEQIESGDALDPKFREAAKDEIERFRRDFVERGGTWEEAAKITDAELLREAMNTVGKRGKLGADIRCVVSVSMLTEGWDAQTVTHILGVRAFGTQLLCEQVVGRALRRQSYEVNEEGRFDPEYADVLGVPFDFTAKPIPPVPRPVQPATRVHAVRPERDAREIRFPHVEGYRTELPEDRLTAKFTDDSTLTLDPETVGPAETTNQGIVGLPEELRPDRNKGIRTQTLAFHLTRDLLRRHLRGANEEPRLHLFGQVKRIVTDWLEGGYLRCEGGTHRGQVLYEEIAERACERIGNAISAGLAGTRRALAVPAPYNPEGSTADVDFTTTRTSLWQTDAGKCHVNFAVCDSGWEMAFCRILEKDPRLHAYVKNDGLGFEIPYRHAGQSHRYRPDFIVVVEDAAGAAVHLVVEIKGLRDEQDQSKADTIRSRWIPGVNNLGTWGRWEFLELTDANTMAAEFGAFVTRLTTAAA